MVLWKIEADAQAIMWLALASDRHSALEITDYADRYVKDRLQSLPGVASIAIALFHPATWPAGIKAGLRSFASGLTVASSQPATL